MAILASALTALLLSSAAVAQTLNPWPARVFTNHDEFTDGDGSTFATDTVPTHAFFLFNSWQNLAGFYVQSSGSEFATDFYVTATVDWPLTKLITVGQVCGATSTFTLVRFADNHGNDYVRSDSYFLQVTGAKGNASAVRINEVWPIFVGDEIVDPENTGPCPAEPSPAEPSATATPAVRKRRALADAA